MAEKVQIVAEHIVAVTYLVAMTVHISISPTPTLTKFDFVGELHSN